MNALGRLLGAARRARGLTLPALADRLGYRNASKGARRLGVLEAGGGDPGQLLQRLVAELGLDPAAVAAAQEHDRLAALDALQQELRRPLTPHVVIRWLPAVLGAEPCPRRLATEGAREAWACARARELGRKLCLRLSRRHSVWIDATGAVTSRTETTPENPRNAPRSALPWLLAFALVATLACARDSTPSPPTATASPATVTLTLVSFPTHDGGVLYADQYGTGTHGVVLVHGGRFRRDSWAAQGRALAAAGFRALAIDHRGEGESRAGPGPKAEGDGIHHDVLDAVRWLRATGATTVSVVGGSLGGWAAAQASVEARSGEIDRLVLLAHSPIEQPERMQGRKLFLLARDDPGPGGVPRLLRIREQFERCPEPKELVLVDGSAHAQFLFETDQGERVLGEILRFLSAP